jgi:creatinine amidohydrolase/Fe(II)-dependent formamide hydrolase-like protein
MLHLRPELVDREAIIDDEDRTADLVLSYTVAETSQTGTTGRPTRGSAREGAELFDLVVTELARRMQAARNEQPPLPGQ